MSNFGLSDVHNVHVRTVAIESNKEHNNTEIIYLFFLIFFEYSHFL